MINQYKSATFNLKLSKTKLSFACNIDIFYDSPLPVKLLHKNFRCYCYCLVHTDLPIKLFIINDMGLSNLFLTFILTDALKLPRNEKTDKFEYIDYANEILCVI